MERFGLLVENLARFHTHRRELGAVGASEMRSLDPGNRVTIAGQYVGIALDMLRVHR